MRAIPPSLSLSIYLFSAALLKLLKVSNRFLTEVAHVRTCFLPMFTAATAPAPAPASEPLLSLILTSSLALTQLTIRAEL